MARFAHFQVCPTAASLAKSHVIKFQKMKHLLIRTCLAVLLMGGRRANALDSVVPGASENGEVVARIHWLGKKGISTDTNAAGLVKIWDLPETAKFQDELVEKCAAAPWRLIRGETNRNSGKLIGPIIRDMLEDESYIEIRQPASATEGRGELVFAIRLSKEKSESWKTNLASALESLTAIRPMSTKDGWLLKKHHIPNLIQLGHAGDWTVLGAAQETNTLFDETMERIRKAKTPFEAPARESWLHANIDLPRAAAALGHASEVFRRIPRILLTVNGVQGQNVRVAGQIIFPQAISIALHPWNIPTNLISDGLSSLTVMRGWMPEFASQWWEKAYAGPLPDQLYIWSYDAVPMETYVAAPVADASNVVSELSDYVLKKNEAWFATHDLAKFQRAKTFNGLEWKGAPFISPFVKSTNTQDGNFVLAGFFPLTSTEEMPPETMMREIQTVTNLVYCEWEETGPRIEELNYLIQFFRLVSGEDQLPVQSIGMQWLLSMRKKLGPSSTQIVHSGPAEFSFTRSSGIPFTALELHWLVAWLESRDFPAIRTFPSSGSHAGN